MCIMSLNYGIRVFVHYYIRLLYYVLFIIVLVYKDSDSVLYEGTILWYYSIRVLVYYMSVLGYYTRVLYIRV